MRGSSSLMPLYHKLAAESFGTFCLVFAGTGAMVVEAATHAVTSVGIAITFGLVVMAMIYAVGNISGAHLNPAVTFGLWLSGRFAGALVFPYLMAQGAGALAASVLLGILFPLDERLGATIPAGSWSQSFLLETILTMILMVVILLVATGGKERGVLAGLAIGGVVALEALFAGPISGASMNPVRSLAPAIVAGRLESVWIYLVAPILGAAIGVAAWLCINQTKESASDDEAIGEKGE